MTTAPTTLATARALLAAGWSPIPLPAQAKHPPPNGVTGWRGRYTTTADLSRTGWDWTGNLAIRLPRDVAGIDVDAYNGGSLDDLEARFGPLPPTTWSTSRDDGSGIALYRVPNGTVLATNPATGVDIIQSHHRYTVCAPSINPKTEAAYRWIDEQSGEVVDVPPEPGELPDLPWAWIDGLAMAKMAGAHAVAPAEADTFINTHTNSTRPAALKGLSTRLEAVVPGGRHDALVETSCWAMREAAAGYYPANDAIELLHRWWVGAVADDPARREGGEFGAAILWAIGQAGTDPERIQAIRDRPHPRSNAVAPPDGHGAGAGTETPEASSTGATAPQGVDPETGEIIRYTPRNLPDEFWAARPSLEHIRAAAHSRARSADAVLLSVLARVAATIPPTVRLPPIVGSPASLSTLVALIGTSGSGKTTAAEVARELYPINRKDAIADQPLGSGEGLVERFFELVEEEQSDGKNKKVKRQTKTALLLVLDEGQALGEMGNRKGATLLPTLRSAWAGATIGNTNASAETYRVLTPHSYRIAAIVGFQVEHATGLIDDAAGGTPQRFVFASANDPTVPDEPPAWPGELTPWLPATSGVELLDVDTAVETEIRGRGLATTRGGLVIDPLDSHRDLVRLKVAALLAWLDHRLDINADDWELAGRVVATSGAVRAWIVEAARQRALAAEMEGHKRAARREEIVGSTVTGNALDRAARAVGRRAQKVDHMNHSDIGKAISSRDRKLVEVDDVIEETIRLQWIEPHLDGWKAGKATPT